tara:strand:+ start:855 stop:1376 length:522 start_codon:yes stop_codon:yes gene_type:complete
MNQNLITAIDYKIDINKLQKDTTKVLETYPFNKHNQICFQNTNINYNPYQGTGDSRLDHCPMYGLQEEDFIVFNPEFHGTVFEEIWKTFPHKMGRMRLMKVPAKKCYWMHNDPGIVRYHFAIDTNPDCFILYRDYGHYHIPADGVCYKMDTDEHHTAVNASRDDRIHLVISGI